MKRLEDAGFEMRKDGDLWKFFRTKKGAVSFPPDLMEMMRERHADVVAYLEGRTFCEVHDEQCGLCKSVITTFGQNVGVLCDRRTCPFRIGSI